MLMKRKRGSGSCRNSEILKYWILSAVVSSPTRHEHRPCAYYTDSSIPPGFTIVWRRKNYSTRFYNCLKKKVISPGLQLFEKFLWASTLWIFHRLIHSTMFYNIRPKLRCRSTFITIYNLITWPFHLNYFSTVDGFLWWCDSVFLNIELIFCQYW